MNVCDRLFEQARVRPDDPAIEQGERILTFAELVRLVDGTAQKLADRGIVSGDVVLLILRNSPEHFVLLFALARLGAVIFSMGRGQPQDEFQANVALARPKAMIYEEGDRKARDLPCYTPEELCEFGDVPFAAPALDAEHPLMLVQSSGTSGKPKAFLRSHRQMIEYIEQYVVLQEWSPQDRYFVMLSLSFNAGRNIAMGILQIGATVVISPGGSTEDIVAEAVTKRCTVSMVTPGHLRSLIEYGKNRSMLFPEMRAIYMGTAPITHEERLLARGHVVANFIEQFGVNEGGVVARAKPAEQDAYPDSVGRIAQNIEAKVVDDSGKVLAPGDVGLIGFRGPGFSTSYVNNPEATARAFRDGWFFPGDLASVNADGYMFFMGRADDIINNEGAKFYPIEVERVLMRHPQIKEAAVFGWPHKKFGSYPVAYLVCEGPLERRAVRKHCMQHMAKYKTPGSIRLVSALPKNSIGKVLKRELKERFGAEEKKKQSEPIVID